MDSPAKSIRKLFLDFESLYSDDYSLKHVTPYQYVLDPRFEALGCAFAWEDEPAFWVDGPDLPTFYKTVDWKRTWAISHNALFDMCILAFRNKVFPARYGCTLSMAQNCIVHSTGRVSLAACCKHYGMPDKWDTVLQMKGVNYQHLLRDPVLHQHLRDYGLDDVGKCRELFGRMTAEGFPKGQHEIIDMVIRMVTQPKLQLCQETLAMHMVNIKAHKKALLDAVGMETRDNLMKDAALAAMLIAANVVPPMKFSKTSPDKKIFAFAKTDKEFTALLDHDDPDVQALVAARLGHKSTLEETRTQRLIDIAAVSEMLPVPLRYHAAHTGRLGGDWKINMQNLPRGGMLRKALLAPRGHVVVSVDASQIEARINAVLSGQDDLVEAFRSGEDVYSSFAESIYAKPVNKKDTPTERFVGKTGILSLGYGSSWPVFQNMCRIQGGVKLPDYQASTIVSIYRAKYRQIVENWWWASNTVLPILAGGNPLLAEHLHWGPVRLERNAILLPDGNKLYYRDLRKEPGAKGVQWVFMRGPQFTKIYGAKVVENVVQALAFIHIIEVALRVKEQTRGLLMPAHQVHDELLYVVPEGVAERVAAFVRTEMAKPPAWMPSAPLAAESKIGISYGDTK